MHFLSVNNMSALIFQTWNLRKTSKVAQIALVHPNQWIAVLFKVLFLFYSLSYDETLLFVYRGMV